MLLRDFITELQELHEQEIKLNSVEPEVVIHTYRQTDSIGNFEYSGTSTKIIIEPQGKNKPVVIYGEDDFEETDPMSLVDFDLKNDFRYQIEIISAYPRVKANIESLWGTQKGRDYILGLAIDDRPGRENSKVKGFPPEIYETINNLMVMHDRTFPKFVPPTKPWDIKI